MILKPQDTLVALKFHSINRNKIAKENQQTGFKEPIGLKPDFGQRDLSEAIGISQSEISKSVKRLEKSRLIVSREKDISVVKNNLIEWIIHGLKYYSPLEFEGYGRGIGTGWNCVSIISDMVPPSPGWAWADSGGDIEAEFVKPFHASVPLAAMNDKWMYKVLSVIEVIRGGKPRELARAHQFIETHIKG